MTPPNMSGRTDTPTTTDGVTHRDPESFLTDDGEFDVASAKRVSNQSIRPDDCAELRRSVRGEHRVGDVKSDWSDTAVRRHVRGNCACPVTVSTLTYDTRAETWVVDDE